MLTKTEKEIQFDRYWQTRDLEKADLRSRQRSQIALEMLGQKSGRLLDVGCGRGWNAAFFKEQGFRAEAIDISPQAVELTASRGVPASVFDLEQDELDGKYDVILCLETLQFLVDPHRSLRKLEFALEDNGELILSLPNEFHLLCRIKIFLGRPNFGASAPHLRLFCPAEIRRLIDSSGLKIEKTHPVSIIPPSFGLLSKIGDLFAQLLPGLFSLCIVVKATKKNGL